MPLSAYAVTCLMSGLSLAIWLWQIMQVFTLGMPAIGPFSTLSWQSVQTACFAMCVLCGKGIGCSGRGRMLKNSRAASPAVRCAVVKTDDDDTCDGWAPHAEPQAHANTTTADLKVCTTPTRSSAGLQACPRRGPHYLPWRL